MPVSIKVNGVANTLVHKGSNGISTATIPDVCKTPSPGGPVPMPYPNVSQSSTLAKGSTTVKADGGMMIAIKGSQFSLSNGDQPGTAGGVKSSTFMKESTWILYSFDVKINGKNACRLTDKKFQNHENTADLAGVIQDPRTVQELETMLCQIWRECEDQVNKAHSDQNKNGKWCWQGSPPNAFTISNQKHSCCKQKIDGYKAKAKNNVLKETTPERSFPVPGTHSKIRADVSYGSGAVPKKLYDFKFQCPPKPQASPWPLYSSVTKGARKPPAPAFEGYRQNELYEEVTGREPQMISEHSDKCKG